MKPLYCLFLIFGIAHFMSAESPAPPAGWSSNYVVANGIRIHYLRTGGEKQPLIMLHGYSDNGLTWTNLAKELTDRFDIILPDARGHGLSDPPSKQQAADTQVEDLAAFIRALNLEKPVIMGHSMGSASAAWFASRYPDVAKAVILEDPRLIPRPPNPKASSPEVIQKKYSQIIARNNMSYEALLALAEEKNPNWSDSEKEYWAPSKQLYHPNTAYPYSSQRPDMSDVFKKITAPTLILKADAQGEVKQKEQDIASILKNGQLAHIKDAGHSVRRDQHDALLQVLNSFLNNL